MSEIEKYLEQSPQLTKAVVGYCIHRDGVLLGLRKKVSFGLGENLISGIGGKVGDEEEFKNETDREALEREFKEEVNIAIQDCKQVGKVVFLFPHKPKWNQEVTIWIITNWTGNPQETDVIKPIWFDKNELPKSQMWPDNLIWLPQVLDGKEFNGTFLYTESNQIKEFKEI